MGLCAVALCLVLSPAAIPVAAATASLVVDVNSVTPPFHENDLGPRQLTPLGQRIVFVESEASSGDELWASDGSDAGTALLRDLCPGSCSSDIRILGTVGSVAFLAVGDAVHGELWRTDGTRGGTFRLSLDFDFQATFAVGARALFAAVCPTSEHCELWRSDGTAAGTAAIHDLPGKVYGAPSGLTAAGGRAFVATADGTGAQLWVSDGTPAGTSMARSFSGGAGPSLATAAGSRLFFVASAGAARQLWTSDGTAVGTRPLASFPGADPFARTVSLRAAGGKVYFKVGNAAGGADLWASDGTAAGTVPLTAFGAADRFPYPFLPGMVEPLGDRVLFVALDGAGDPRLWAAGGNPSSAAPLAGCAGGCPLLESLPSQFSSLVRLGDRVLFAGSYAQRSAQLWASDGTGAGTRVVSQGEPADLGVALGAGYFAASTPGGEAVFRTDGTAAGTRRLTPLGTGPTFDSPLQPVAAGGKVFFSAAPSVEDGPQLWTTDGTTAGTALVTLIGVDGPSSAPQGLARLGGGLVWIADSGREVGVWTTVPGGALRLTADTADPVAPLTVAGAFAYFVDGGTNELWRTDGTPAGTVPLAALPGPLVADPVAFGGGLAFAVMRGDGGLALWASDGTTAGTVQRVDLKGLVQDLGSLTALGSPLYFAGGDLGGGSGQVWASDGTAAGTRQLTHFAGTGVFSVAPSFTRVGARVFFVASPSDDGTELWTTDGTAAGTAAVLPHSTDSLGRNLSNLTAFGGAVYYLAGSQAGGLAGRGLWRSDGTAAGTVLLKPLGAQPSLLPERVSFAALGGALFFDADDGEHGRELWRTDGTAAGTLLVKDIAPGAASSSPASLVASGGLLYFTAADGDHGFELWQSDGTAAGTRLVQDLAPGALSASPDQLVAGSDRLFFAADDGVFGREVWSYPLAAGPPSCQPSATALCLQGGQGGRFRVEIEWRDFQGNTGPGHAVAVTADTGTFWFFAPANVEAIVKVLDGRPVDGHFWVFYGALSSVEYTLTVTDTTNGATRRYFNPSGHFGSVGDTQAFGPLGATGSASSTSFAAAAAEQSLSVEPPVVVRRAAVAPCVAGPARLCLNGGRFAVEARWRDFQGHTGTGTAAALSGDTGYFWFFSPTNVEVVLKVLDGRAVNGKFWVFYGALSSVEYTLTVTDTATGVMRTYTNPSGRFASVGDTGAF